MDLIASKGNNIYASPKLVRIPEFQKILREYGVDVFGQFIIFLYYVYKTYSKSGNDDDISYMSEMSINDRISRVFEYHVDRKYRELFLDGSDFEAAVNIYQSIELTKVEQMYYNVKKDIDDYLEKLSKIPFDRIIAVTLDTPKELIAQGYPATVKTKVKMANIAEKKLAITTANELLSYLKKMEEVAMAERKKVVKKSGKDIKMFEDPEAVKEFEFKLFNEAMFEEPKNVK